MVTQIETSDLIRLGTGTLSQGTLLGSSGYLISNFPLQSDMPDYPGWLAWIDGGVSDGQVIQALSGSGKIVGKMSGTLTFAVLTPDMQDHIFTTILQSKHVNAVSMIVFHPRYKTLAINCQLAYPANINTIGNQQTDNWFTNVTFNWNRGVVVGNAYSNAYSTGYS